MVNVTPAVGSIKLVVNGTTVIGVTSASLTEKVQMEDCTADQDTAIRRNPTIDDAELKATFLFDANSDAGQQAILTAKQNHALVTITKYLKGTSGPNHTLNAYIENIAWSGDPKTNLKADVTFAVSGGATYHNS